jgi:hypothetical protein
LHECDTPTADYLKAKDCGEEVDITTNYDEDMVDARMALPNPDEMPATGTATGNYYDEFEDDFASDDEDGDLLDTLDLDADDSEDELLYDGTVSGEETDIQE